MKCALSIVFLAVCAAEFITAIPVRNGMVFYQSNPGYYDGHRAFVMQYASRPVKSHRRNGIVPESSVNGVSAFVAGKKVSTGTIVKQQQSFEESDELPVVLDGATQSIAISDNAADEEVEEVEESFEDDVQSPAETPIDDEQSTTSVDTTKKKLPKKPVKPVLAEEEEAEDDEEEDEAPPAPPAVTANRSRSKGGQSGPIYFPVHFGSTNGGAIAVANSYSTGKGGSASSHATAYGSPSSKAKKSAIKKKTNKI